MSKSMEFATFCCTASIENLFPLHSASGVPPPAGISMGGKNLRGITAYHNYCDYC